jgi:RNA polymerase sigma-70 factor (ECF subfamily)
MPDGEGVLDAAQAGDEHAFELLVAPYVRELRTHCYRMAGSIHDADDLMQESLLKAWKGLPTFERRSNLRTWLYKVTTSVCLDVLDKREPRMLPMELGPAAGPGDPIGPPRFDLDWLEPCPAGFYSSAELSPAAQYERRQSVELAFLIAIQLLPSKQRAMLLLHDVIGFLAAECAELLEISTAAANSALQRARTTLSARGAELRAIPPTPLTIDESVLLQRYMRAWESTDIQALVELLLDDATLEMPPLPQWLSGADAIAASIGSMVFAPAGPGVFRLIQTEANGQPAFGVYQLDRDSGEMRVMGLHLLRLRDARIASITAFLNSQLLSEWGLPHLLPADEEIPNVL